MKRLWKSTRPPHRATHPQWPRSQRRPGQCGGLAFVACETYPAGRWQPCPAVAVAGTGGRCEACHAADAALIRAVRA